MIETLIRDVPNFPKPGIVFKDITPLLQDPRGLPEVLERFERAIPRASYDVVCGIESRGFIFGTALAVRAAKGFVPVRKPGKLPYKTARESYELEYGQDTIEIHVDAVTPGQRVLIVDDLLATGGTMRACCQLVHQMRADIVGITVLIELAFLNGRDVLREFGEVHSVITY